MARRKTSRRVAATAVALLGLFLATSGAAEAAVTGQASSSSQSVSSGTFAVVPTLLTSGTPPPAPAALTMTVLTPRAYFNAVNTGTIDLVAASYNLNMTYVGTGTPTVTLAACPGNAWNQTLNTCPVGIVTIGSWSAGSSSYTASSQVPASPGNRLHLRATVSVSIGGIMVSAAATANVQVSSGPTRQIRAAITTNA